MPPTRWRASGRASRCHAMPPARRSRTCAATPSACCRSPPVELVSEELDDWARLGVEGHEHARRPWIPYHENLTAGLAALTGARPDEVVAMNSLTVNLHLMLASFYRPQGRRTRILMEAGAFSSDRHAVASQIAWHGLEPATRAHRARRRAAGEDGAARRGHRGVPGAARRADRAGAVAGGAVPHRPGVRSRPHRAAARAPRLRRSVSTWRTRSATCRSTLHDSDADFAVWCSYKYLNGGPGAIGGCFVNQRHAQAQPRDRHAGALPGARLAGWWGHEEPTRFLMEPQFRASAGAAAWQISNPSVLSAAPLHRLAAHLPRGRHRAAARQVASRSPTTSTRSSAHSSRRCRSSPRA